ncbi:MAG: phospholipid methyltransferase, partial [Flavobacteriales bacterium]|nr:phospholipid methyltransferase [Flavobacteriales bacterium]
MVKIGNFLFKYRNMLFPLFYLCLFIPSPQMFEDVRIPLIIGFIIALKGQLVRVMTIGLKYIVRGGRDKKVYAEDLVTEGIFSHCRNPLYVGNVLMLIGTGFMSNSWFFNLVMSPLFFFFYEAIIRAEENYLRGRFGQGYEDYCKDVHRWFFKIKGLGTTLKSMTFNWYRVMVKEYNTSYIWLTGVVLVIANVLRINQNATYLEVRWYLLGVMG